MIAIPVLVINSGSSSLKCSLFDMEDGREVLAGLAERLNTAEAELTWHIDGKKHRCDIPQEGHAGALATLNEIINQIPDLQGAPVAIGHRVVHGGEAFAESVIINDKVIRGIEHCSNLAPLHNPANLLGIQLLQRFYPKVPQVAVFDTAFHQTLAEEAYLYALPMSLYHDQGVRRYGFHGTSHRYVSQQAVTRLGLDPNDHAIITAHLGNGCSAAAIRNGRSIDTTMGMTPLEGLVMGTRSGDVDPGLHEYLAEQQGWSIQEITQMLNRNSGLLGLSGISNDMRTLTEAAKKGDDNAQRAIDVFCFRLARQIGALAASLGRLDALVFTGGIGENAVGIRANVLKRLSLFGFVCDKTRNAKPDKTNGLITQDQSPPACVIATREEWMIAHDAHRLTTTESK